MDSDKTSTKLHNFIIIKLLVPPKKKKKKNKIKQKIAYHLIQPQQDILWGVKNGFCPIQCIMNMRILVFQYHRNLIYHFIM